MALTNAQKRELIEIFSPFIQRRLEDGDTSFIADIFNPDAPDYKPFVQNKLNNRKTALLNEQSGLLAAGQARNAQINAEIAVIDSILAKLV